MNPGDSVGLGADGIDEAACLRRQRARFSEILSLGRACFDLLRARGPFRVSLDGCKDGPLANEAAPRRGTRLLTGLLKGNGTLGVKGAARVGSDQCRPGAQLQQKSVPIGDKLALPEPLGFMPDTGEFE